MPALRLDAAFVHVNRADTAGNGQVLGPDPFFDELFLGAADRRFVTTERIVETGALADDGHPLSTVPIHRLLTDGVAEAPGGAHFTASPPDYGRDEAFQKEYAAAAGDPTSGRPSPHRYLLVDEDGYQARVAGAAGADERTGDGVTRAEFCVIACAEAWRGDGEVMASPFGTIPALGARLAKLTFAPDLVLTDGEAALMVGAPPLGTPPGELVLEAAMPYRSVFDVVWSGRRHIMMMATQIDRYGQPEHLRHRPLDPPEGPAGRRARRARQHRQPPHQLLGARPHRRAPSSSRSTWCAASATTGPPPPGPAATRFHDVRRVVSNLGVFDFETPDHTMRLRSVHPGVTVDDVVAATGFELTIPDDVAETRLPTPEELELIREVLDPGARCATAR